MGERDSTIDPRSLPSKEQMFRRVFSNKLMSLDFLEENSLSDHEYGEEVLEVHDNYMKTSLKNYVENGPNTIVVNAVYAG